MPEIVISVFDGSTGAGAGKKTVASGWTDRIARLDLNMRSVVIAAFSSNVKAPVEEHGPGFKNGS